MTNFIKMLFDNITEICLVIIIVAIVAMTFMWIEVTEPLKTISSLVVWAFFWSKVPWIVTNEK